MEILAVVGVREIVKVVVVSCCFSYLYPQPKVLDGDVVYRFAFFVSSSYPPDLAAYKKHLLLHYRSQMKIFFSASFHRILCNDRASQVMLWRSAQVALSAELRYDAGWWICVACYSECVETLIYWQYPLAVKSYDCMIVSNSIWDTLSSWFVGEDEAGGKIRWREVPIVNCCADTLIRQCRQCRHVGKCADTCRHCRQCRRCRHDMSAVLAVSAPTCRHCRHALSLLSWGL